MYLWAPFSFKPLQVGPTHLFLFPFLVPETTKGSTNMTVGLHLKLTADLGSVMCMMLALVS